MLESLRIKNLALLEDITLEFDKGFTTITGETGAGKSILIEALNILSGSRVDKTIIRQGSSTCEIEALLYFPNPSPINDALEKLNLPPCLDNSLILKRSIDKEKSSKIQINGSFATLQSLQILGEFWIDFHRPDEPQKLFKHQYQLGILDLYSNLTPSLKTYTHLYHQWKNLENQIQELSEKESLSDDEIHFYQAQITKIDSVNPDEDGIKELENNFARITHAQEIGTLATQLESGLRDDQGIIPTIYDLIKPAGQLSKLLPSTSVLSDRLNSLIIEAEDIASEYAAITGSNDNDPTTLQEIQSRMNTWCEIKRQFGPSLENILKKRQSLFEKISMQSNIEFTLNNLRKESATQKLNLEKLANSLLQKRQEATIILVPKVQNLLHTLGFQNTKLEIKIHKENTLNEFGNCYVEFLFTPNKGQHPMPLHKIASSGETARVLLAFKTILAEIDQTAVLVFDEIDANIGGEIASKVANALKIISKNHQVFCITHLPQTAAHADTHFIVNKESDLHETKVIISKLSHPQQKIQELARMFGDRTCESALNHAKDLLAIAE